MKPLRPPILVVLALVAACAAVPVNGQPSVLTAERVIPRGAAVSATGHASIVDAPPALFDFQHLAAPEPASAEQISAQEQFRRSAQFQSQVMEQVQALAGKLRRAEKGNFVDLYFENDGDPHVVFRFLRDGERTLAKYTKHPRFFATDVRYSRREVEAAMNFMLETFREDRVIAGGGTGSKSNRADVEINVTEKEFRSLVAIKGVKIPEAVKLEFRVKEPASTLNRQLPSEIASLVRIFPRDDRPTGMLHSINGRAKVVLRDGCFRLADHADALALFPLGAQLFIDQEGYLAFGAAQTPGYARVGETIVTPGSIGEVTAPELVEPIHAACGPGKVIKINGMRSDAADRFQNRVTQMHVRCRNCGSPMA